MTTSIQPPPSVSAKHGIKAFNRMAVNLGSALKAVYAGNSVSFLPGPLSPDTWREYFRRAIQAKQKYDWTSPDVDDELFIRYADKLMTSLDERNWVVVGTKETLATLTKPLTSTQVAAPLSPSSIEVRFNHPSFHVLCGLIRDKAFDPCPIFIISNVDGPTARILEKEYGLILEPYGDPDKNLNQWQIL